MKEADLINIVENFKYLIKYLKSKYNFSFLNSLENDTSKLSLFYIRINYYHKLLDCIEEFELDVPTTNRVKIERRNFLMNELYSFHTYKEIGIIFNITYPAVINGINRYYELDGDKKLEENLKPIKEFIGL